MKPKTIEWAAKAEGDFRTAMREISASEFPNYDAVCYHSQQCAEKYLKALLVEAGISFPKTHDLSLLLQLITPMRPTWTFLVNGLDILTSMESEVRYPGVVSDLEDAREAIRLVKQVRDVIRPALEM